MADPKSMTLPGTENSLPMFYGAPRPLDRAKDANLKISRPTHFRFAGGTNAIPLADR